VQADWEFEVGGDAPVIDAHWPGLVDLRLAPERAIEIQEAKDFAALGPALEQLNAPASPVWTSKCDFFPQLEPGEFDPDELDAPPGSAACASACYIDMLPLGGQWSAAADAADACKHICGLLGVIALRCCRVDLLVRRAVIAPGSVDLGITAYLTACGATPVDGTMTLGAALAAFADAVSSARLPANPL
jgi:hypothetical protein